MTTQEIFNKVALHLLTQKAKSYAFNEDDDIICMYRGINGLTCAVGCLIPDDKYIPAMEGKTARELLSGWPDCIPGLVADEDTMSCLTSLQGIHDDMPVHDWRLMLEKYAQYTGLTMPQIPNQS